jgi:phosphoribosylformylglycinamidine synthase subunit PurL
LFAEPASTVLISTVHENTSEIEKLANDFSYLCTRIGTTGGDRLEISVYGDLLISARISELRKPWARSLEAALHNEVTA